MSILKSDTYSQFIRRYRMDRFQAGDDRRLFNEVLALRIRVLVQGEGFDLAGEPDAYDETATHWAVRHSETYEVFATTRMLKIDVPLLKSPEQLETLVLLDKFVVCPEHREEGIGRFLMVDILSHIREKLNLKRIGVVAHTKSLTFFESMGFISNNRLATYVPLPEGAILMEKMG